VVIGENHLMAAARHVVESVAGVRVARAEDWG